MGGGSTRKVGDPPEKLGIHHKTGGYPPISWWKMDMQLGPKVVDNPPLLWWNSTSFVMGNVGRWFFFLNLLTVICEIIKCYSCRLECRCCLVRAVFGIYLSSYNKSESILICDSMNYNII